MTKKNKTGIIIGVIVLVIAGFIGKYQYDEYKAEQNRDFSKMSLLFMVMYPEDKDLRKSNYTDDDLKEFLKTPPRIQIDTSNGLGMKVSAYNYYNNEDIDPYIVQDMMETGDFNKAYEYTSDFIHWSNNYSGEIMKYQNAVNYASIQLGYGDLDPTNTAYQEYLKIINDPDGQKYIDEYYVSIGNRR